MTQFCRHCGDLMWGDHHCPPCWDCRMEEGDWKSVHAPTIEAAVQKFCRQEDQRWGNYPSSRTVEVKDREQRLIRVFEVELRMEPVYDEKEQGTLPWEGEGTANEDTTEGTRYERAFGDRE